MRVSTPHLSIQFQLLSALATGVFTFLCSISIGSTPMVRALGMALTIAITTLTLQRFSASLGIVGGLALAFSPAFWSQTGGQETQTSVIVSIMLLSSLPLIGLLIKSKWLRQEFILVMVLIFCLIFVGTLGYARSLRVTILLASMLFFVMIDLLLMSNPRPDTPPYAVIPSEHILILVLLSLIGVANDPLFVLLAPSIVIGLYISRVQIPAWYWAAIIVVVAWGAYGTIIQYIATDWLTKSAETAEASGMRVPYVIADGWREAARWIYLINLVRNQFTDVGILLGVIGLARLSRWYPPLGITTMIAYAAYAIFGLVYFGKDSSVILLPLLMIHVLWMTYAAYTIGQWLQKSITPFSKARWLATAAYTLLPLTLLARITGVL